MIQCLRDVRDTSQEFALRRLVFMRYLLRHAIPPGSTIIRAHAVYSCRQGSDQVHSFGPTGRGAGQNHEIAGFSLELANGVNLGLPRFLGQ